MSAESILGIEKVVHDGREHWPSESEGCEYCRLESFIRGLPDFLTGAHFASCRTWDGPLHKCSCRMRELMNGMDDLGLGEFRAGA